MCSAVRVCATDVASENWIHSCTTGAVRKKNSQSLPSVGTQGISAQAHNWYTNRQKFPHPKSNKLGVSRNFV